MEIHPLYLKAQFLKNLHKKEALPASSLDTVKLLMVIPS